VIIYLVRHGQSELNAAGIRHGCEVDPSLTDLGVRQAKMAGGELYGLCETPPVILSSPAIRARQTADLIVQMTGGDHHPDISALAERRYDTATNTWTETCAQAAKRAWEVMQSVNSRTQATTVVVVTHAGVIKGLTSSGVTPPNGSVRAFGEWAFESSDFLICGPS
jgi:broad specificity phosphatase PhoE